MLHEDNSGPDNPQEQNPAPQNTGGDEGGDEYNVTDPDEGGGDENQDTTQTDDTPDDTAQDNDQENNDEGEDEYNITDPDEENPDDNENNDDSSGSDDNDPSAKLRELEKSIFDQLPAEMQQAKTAELKKLYTDTYSKCQSVIDLISTTNKKPDQAKVYDYVLNTLLDLQKYIKDYLSNIFDSKTYIENMTELQKYLTILDTVNGVFKDMAEEPESK